MKPSIVRVVIKDLIDFSIVVGITLAFTVAIYFIVPSFADVSLSFFFFEQYLELFFVNPRLTIWFFGLAFGVTMLYFLFCGMLYQNTFGGVLAGIILVDRNSNARITLRQSLLMAIGAFCGAALAMVGPLYAWWLEDEHRGVSEFLANVVLRKA